MSSRLSNIAAGNKDEADMSIHMGKTKNMHVRKQTKLAPLTITEIKQTEAG